MTSLVVVVVVLMPTFGVDLIGTSSSGSGLELGGAIGRLEGNSGTEL